MKRNESKQRGITLVSLVITIIILLILAGVSIATFTGNSGLLAKASESKQKTEEAQEKEGVRLAVIYSKMEDVSSLEITKDNLEKALKAQLGINAKFTITNNGNGSFTIKFDNTDRMYYVESSGKVITNDNILRISTADNLKIFRDEVNNGNTFEGKCIILTNDITLNITEEWEPIGVYLNDSATPDNENNAPFKGNFDGQGHKVNGIYINTTNKVQGFFGLVENGSVVNLEIGENNNITGGNATAGVVGYLYNGASISNCYNKSNVNGNFTGGIVGCAFTNTTILNCNNSGKITGMDEGTGGIVGKNMANAKVVNSYNTGEVAGGSNYVGGIAGSNINSIIETCYNTGNISGNSFCGGITGGNNSKGIVSSVYNIGIVKGTTNNVGGVVGKNYINAKLIDAYNTGKVTGDGDRVGGVIGYNQESEVSNCYNIGAIIGTNTKNVGGVIGAITGDIIVRNNYYAENTVNNSNGSILEGIEAKTLSELKTLYTLLGENWRQDINNINNGYPILSWQ